MMIDWMYPVGVVYNVIRGCNPSPGAATTCKGQQLKIFDCERRALSGPQAPGTVMEITDDGFLVAANGGSIFVMRVQPAGAAKLPAPEFASSVGLKVRDQLGGTSSPRG
jgi:methionyl-tRNA formyltransferase